MKPGAGAVVRRAFSDSVLVRVIWAGAVGTFGRVADATFSGVAVSAGAAGPDLAPEGAARGTSNGG